MSMIRVCRALDGKLPVFDADTGEETEYWFKLKLNQYGPLPRWLLYHDGDNKWRVERAMLLGTCNGLALVAADPQPRIVGAGFLFERRKVATKLAREMTRCV